MGGRHRSSWLASLPVPSPSAIVVGWLVLALAFGVVGWYLTSVRPLCRGELALTVHAEPAVVPPLKAAAARLRGKRAAVDGVCIHATVLDREPARVAAHVTGTASGEASPDDLPDVWVPDSTLWLDLVRAREQSKSEVPPAAVSLATSPIVVAMTRPVAGRLATQDKIAWSSLLDQLSAREPLVFGMPDPGSSAAGIAALYGLDAVLAHRHASPAALTATWRALATNAAPTVSDLTGRVPTLPSGSGLHAFPADEASVCRFNREHPGVPLVVVYPTEGTLQLDYPYVVLPRAAADPGKSEAAATLLAETTSPDGNGAVFAAGLRLPDGTAGPQAGGVNGVRWLAPRALKRPAQDKTLTLIREWRAANPNTG